MRNKVLNNFYNTIKPVLILTVLFESMLFLVFWLYDVSFYIALLIVCSHVFILSVFCLFKWTQFKVTKSLQKENEDLRQQLEVQTQQSMLRYNAMENYFLMWIHQIKTPITALKLLIDNSTELQAKYPFNQELFEIDKYTQMAMNYLKLTNPEDDLLIMPVELDKLIVPLIKKYRHHFIQKSIALNYKKSHQSIVTDANLMSIMLEQLLNNALKYSKTGTITIQYDAMRQVLIIQDEGIGISSEDLPKIFERGYGGFNGKLNQQSSGIGLFLVKMIANKLNQPITVESELGFGTQFKIKCHEVV